MDMFNALSVYVFRFVFKADTDLHLNAQPGTAFRGVLGAQLKKQVCSSASLACDSCFFRTQCAYPFLFETPAWLYPQQVKQHPEFKTQSQVPHPINLCYVGKQKIKKSETFSLNVTLVGEAALKQLITLQEVFKQVQLAGKGANRAHLVNVESQFTHENGQIRAVNESDLPATPDSVHVRLLTPLKIKQCGQLLNQDTFNSKAFLSAINRRISHLAHFYGQAPTPFLQVGEGALTKHKAEDCQWHRHSNRQKKYIPMEGFTGDYILTSRQMTDVWPSLWLAQFLQIGKGSLMGLGKYGLTPIYKQKPIEFERQNNLNTEQGNTYDKDKNYGRV
jgi:hypothetical protein